MAILSRFADIIAANVNYLLDKAEDPEKMVDQYLRELLDDLAEVKKDTALIMAEETRTKRLLDENEAQVQKYAEYAKRAVLADNDEDARVFLAKKQELEARGVDLHTTYSAAHENAAKMRQMHDKLVRDINALNARKDSIKVKVAVAKTQERLNKVGEYAASAQSALGAFSRMEEKADRMLDMANAEADLNLRPIDEARALETKYSGESGGAVDDELAALKAELGK